MLCVQDPRAAWQLQGPALIRAVQLQPRELLGGARDPVKEPKIRDRWRDAGSLANRLRPATWTATASVEIVDDNLDEVLVCVCAGS